MTTLPEVLKQHMEPDEAGLCKCAHCGAGVTRSSGNYLPPTMKGNGALVSWEIYHWCEKKEGVVAQSFTVRGRTQEDAMIAYNKRASDPLLLEYARRLEIARENLARVVGKEIGIHVPGDKSEQYYQSWNDGEYWIAQALAAITAPFEGKL